jgi:biopolymer transport protein ExbD
MIDIAFLVLIFFMALPMRSLDAKLAAFLPSTGIQDRDAPPPPKERVVVRVRGGEERPLTYQVGQNRFEKLSGLRQLLFRMGPEYRYEVHADAATPWKHVVKVVDLLTDLHFKDVDFRGTKIPPAAIRRAIPLPDPRPR